MGSDDENEIKAMPNRGYGFELTIEGNDYSTDVVEVHVLSSIEVPYISVLITMFLDPNDIILNKLYGQLPIKLAIRHFGQTHPGFPDQQLDLDLMYVSADFDVQMKNPLSSQYRMKNRSPIQLTTVCREPFKIMNTYVNGVFIGQTVNQIITSLLGSVNAAVSLDTQGINTQTIDQVLIPPVTLYQALRYINKTFGIYDSIPSFYCLQEKPRSRVYIKNLKSKMSTGGNLGIIMQLSAGGSTLEALEATDIEDAGGTGYYTYKNVETQYKGNTVLSILGARMIHIVKPKDKLYTKIDINTSDFIKQNGLVFAGKTIYYDTEAISPNSRVSIFKDNTGYEDTQTYINANWSKLVSDLSTLIVHLERNLSLEPLLQVGESIIFSSMIENMKDFTGKYILASTELAFTVEKREFNVDAKLTLIRSNRTLD